MNFRLIHHGLVDSTSERTFASLLDGTAQHLDVHVARGQTAGRGTQGRTWHSAVDEGLYMSLLLLPDPPPYKPAALTIAAGLAVIECLSDLGLPPFGERAPRLKWPNDVCVGPSKLCGILTETRALDRHRPHYVIGLGLNVRQRSFPSELIAERPITSLAQLGLDLTIAKVLAALLARLEPRLAQVRREHKRLATDFLAASGLEGRRVAVRCGKEAMTGKVQGLSLSSGLELLTEKGEVQWLPVEFVRQVEPLEVD